MEDGQDVAEGDLVPVPEELYEEVPPGPHHLPLLPHALAQQAGEVPGRPRALQATGCGGVGGAGGAGGAGAGDAGGGGGTGGGILLHLKDKFNPSNTKLHHPATPGDSKPPKLV